MSLPLKQKKLVKGHKRPPQRGLGEMLERLPLQERWRMMTDIGNSFSFFFFFFQ